MHISYVNIPLSYLDKGLFTCRWIIQILPLAEHVNVGYWLFCCVLPEKLTIRICPSIGDLKLKTSVI
jgi:hypothetical protein